VTPQQFFDLFIADNASFSYEVYYRIRGDTEIELAQWVANEEMGGFTRDVKFRTKIHGPPIGPKTTRCEIAQQYQMQASRLTIKSSIKALDVPFGDKFLVEQEWTILSIGPDRSVLRISAAINFVKSTMFRSIIENRSRPDITKDNENWLAEMRAKKAFPDVQIAPMPEPKTEEKHHSVTRYDEVDPKLLTRARPGESKGSREKLMLLAAVNGLGLLFLLGYVLFLHAQLSSRLQINCL
jgi:hypothetical protein